jgi:uncharacterized delta-60 repeat protein
VLQPDGKLVVVGQSRTGVGTGIDIRDVLLARYNADGSPDATFGSGGVVVTDLGATELFRGLVVLPDGKLVIGGSQGILSVGPVGLLDFALARYNPDGSLDASFGSGGTVRTDLGGSDLAASLILQSDGKLVLAGDSYTGVLDFALARYNADGSLDGSFGVGGIVLTDLGADDAALALLVRPDGRLVVGGHSRISSPIRADFALAQYLPDGSPDGGFGASGIVKNDFGADEDITALVLQPDGKLVAAGLSGEFETISPRDFALIRYLTGPASGRFSIRVDATALTSTGFVLHSEPPGAFTSGLVDGAAIQRFDLAAGSYAFQVGTGPAMSCPLEVTPVGGWNYPRSCDGLVSGRGTATLVLTGYPVEVDATALGAGSFQLSGLDLALDQSIVQALALVAAEYELSSPPLGFAWTLRPDGTIDYVPHLRRRGLPLSRRPG